MSPPKGRAIEMDDDCLEWNFWRAIPLSLSDQLTLPFVAYILASARPEIIHGLFERLK